jgi:PAS domain S-box-containing protein
MDDKTREVTDRSLLGRRRADIELRESEERFRILMEHLPGVSVQGYDATGTVRYWNNGSETVYGYTPEEALGRNLADLIIPDEVRPGFCEALKVGAARKVSGEFMPAGEIELLRKDGSFVPVYSIHTCVCVEGGSPMLFCIDVDLSDRKRAEEELYESRRRYRLAVEAGNIGVWNWDIAKRVVYAEPNLETMLGFEKGASPRKVEGWLDLIHPEDRERVIEGQLEHLRGQTPFFKDECRIRREGSKDLWVIFQGKATRHVGGRVRHVTGTCVDITQSVHVKRALRASEERYRSITDNLPLGIAVVDKDMRVAAANPRIREWYPDVDFSSNPYCHETFSHMGDSCPCPECPCWRAFQDGQIHEYQPEVPHSVTGRYFRVTACPIFEQAGEVTSVILMEEDITEKLHTQANLERAQRVQAMATMAGGIAHEIAQPLNALQLYAGGLELKLENAEELDKNTIQERLSMILGEAHKIRDIIHHMRTLVYQEEGPRAGAAKISETIPKALSLVKEQFSAHGIRLSLELEEGLPTVRANPVQLEQVIINLAVNAMHALDELERLDKHVSIAAYREGDRVVVSVRDNGLGFEGTGEWIFDPFFTTKKSGEGMGLGLSIVHSLVTQWNGEVRAESFDGGGAVFTVSLHQASDDLCVL